MKAIKADVMHRLGYTGKGVNIAVIDTGLNKEYPIFKDRLLGEKSFITDGIEGVKDEIGHGTHVAGTILSIAPDSMILPVRVFNRWGGTFGDVITDALKYCYFWRGPKGERIHIVNMSLGCPAPDEQMHTVIKEMYKADMYVVAAQGNEGDGDIITEERTYPGYFEETFSVAASDYNGNVIRMSNTSYETDCSAPGQYIYAPYKDGRYEYMTGTSMAAPHAAGAMALLMEAYKDVIDYQNELRRRCRQVMNNTHIEGAGFIDLSMVQYY